MVISSVNHPDARDLFGEMSGPTPVDASSYDDDDDCLIADMIKEGGQETQQDGAQDTQHERADIEDERLFVMSSINKAGHKRDNEARGLEQEHTRRRRT